MATRKDKAEEILAHLQAVADTRIRPMMGEYVLYVDDKVVGQINDNKLFIKVTAFGESFAADLKCESPYPGAKPAFIVPEDRIYDQRWLHDFIVGTVAQLPAAKK